MADKVLVWTTWAFTAATAIVMLASAYWHLNWAQIFVGK
jgi:hypothetical protein